MDVQEKERLASRASLGGKLCKSPWSWLSEDVQNPVGEDTGWTAESWHHRPEKHTRKTSSGYTEKMASLTEPSWLE